MFQSIQKFRCINLASMAKSLAESYLKYYFLGWAVQEAWNPGLHDMKLYFHVYPQAFYVLEVLKDSKYDVAAIIFAPFDSNSHQASIGTYISEKNTYRGKGFGYQLWQHVFQELNKKSENCRKSLYGVPAQVNTYQKSGFYTTHNILHYIMKTDQKYGPLTTIVEDVTSANKSELLSYVKQNYSDGLATFIEKGIDTESVNVRIARDTKKISSAIVGFGMLRPLVDDKSFRYAIITDNRDDQVAITDDLFRSLNQILNEKQLAVLDVRAEHPMTDQYEYYSLLESEQNREKIIGKCGQHWTTEMSTNVDAKDRAMSVGAEPSLETNFLPKSC